MGFTYIHSSRLNAILNPTTQIHYKHAIEFYVMNRIFTAFIINSLQISLSAKQTVTAVSCVKIQWDHFSVLALMGSH